MRPAPELLLQMDEQVAPIMQKHISGNNDSDYAMCLCVCVFEYVWN